MKLITLREYAYCVGEFFGTWEAPNMREARADLRDEYFKGKRRATGLTLRRTNAPPRRVSPLTAYYARGCRE